MGSSLLTPPKLLTTGCALHNTTQPQEAAAINIWLAHWPSINKYLAGPLVLQQKISGWPFGPAAINIWLAHWPSINKYLAGPLVLQQKISGRPFGPAVTTIWLAL